MGKGEGDIMYQFTDDCLTGVGIIDDEHRQLFATMNEISDVLLAENKDKKEVKKLMDTLKQYAATHFEHEEAYMMEIRDPEILRQKKEHAYFTEKIEGIDLDSVGEENGIAVLRDMMEFLSRWLYRHILSSDTMIGKMKKMHGDPVMLSFSNRYMIGVDMIDQEHRRLFEILGELNELNNDEFMYDKFDAILDVVEELKDYTVKHFEDEERYMKEIGYEGLPQQQKVHQAFIDKIEVINLDELDDNQQEYINELIDFLASWLVNHIMKMDQKIPAE